MQIVHLREPRCTTESENALEVLVGASYSEINPYNPGLIERIELDPQASGEKTVVYLHIAGAGPTLVTRDGVVLSTLASYDQNTVGAVVTDATLDALSQQRFQIVEYGPIKVVIKVRGRFHAQSEMADCRPNDGIGETVDPWAYTAVMTFTRGSADVGLRFHVRYECAESRVFSQYQGTDQLRKVNRIAWEFPMAITPTRVHVSGAGGLYVTQDGFVGEVGALQKYGSAPIGDWTRQGALFTHPDGFSLEIKESVTELSRPYVAIDDGKFIAGIQLAWMRYREPQALRALHNRLILDVVSEPMIFGEGMGLWNVGRLSFLPSADSAKLAASRDVGQLGLERGLLLRRPLAEFNMTGVLPPLGNTNNASTSFKLRYASMMALLHDRTLGKLTDPQASEPGQLLKAHTFGSQLWPDYLDYATIPFTPPGGPEQSDTAQNSDDAAGTELLEFFRTGDPKWVWDFAMPLSELMFSTILFNTGEFPEPLNGLLAGYDGKGQGKWHRDVGVNFGYSVLTGLQHAYVLRPNPIWLDRFRQAHAAATFFYSWDTLSQDKRQRSQAIAFHSLDDDDGDLYAMQLMSAASMLQNCAEFVAGDTGVQCLATLQSWLDELQSENIRGDYPCSGDIVAPAPTACQVKGYFTLVRVGFDVFYRQMMALNTQKFDAYKTMLVKTAQSLLTTLLPVADNTIGSSTWYYEMTCDNAGGNCTVDPTAVVPADDRVPLLSLLGLARALDPLAANYCELLLGVTANTDVTDPWYYDHVFYELGWNSHAARQMRGTVFLVGALDSCGTN